MIIIRKKENNIVTHVGPNLELTDLGLWANGSWNPTLNTNTCDALEVESLPPYWQGGAWTYDTSNGWQLVKSELLEQVKENKCVNVENERDVRISQGLSYDFPDGTTDTIQLRNEEDIRNVHGLGSDGLELKMDGDTTTTLPFRDAQNVQHDMTGPELVAMARAVRQWIQGHYSTGWSHKDSIRSLTDVQSVQNYDYSTGWPS